jgi:hypothetical protein
MAAYFRILLAPALGLALTTAAPALGDEPPPGLYATAHGAATLVLKRDAQGRDDAGCRAVLQGVAKDAARSDDEVEGNHGMVFWEDYKPVLHAARTNLRLCGGR